MKFAKFFRLKIFLLLIILSQFYAFKSQFRTHLNNLQNDLDLLINQLQNNKIDQIVKKEFSRKPISEMLESNKKGFEDKIFNAFQSVNHDFIEYENILNENKNKMCTLHNNNIYSGNKNDVEIVTLQISEMMAKLNKNRKKECIYKKKYY